jgi:adenosyl cobinamide kinase/adenosyl cobinamide phosphate guanylyltransferase
MTNLLPFALDYAKSYGWAVHPVDIKKQPTTEHGRDDATTDEATIRHYFKNGAQLAVATGVESGVFVFDVDLDTEKGIDGYATLAALEAKHGQLPHTPQQKTGRGGTQFFFAHVPGLKNSIGKLGHGIDTRGEGGYAVVAPSRNTNGAYEWIISPEDAPLADVPQWMIEALAKEERKPQATTTIPLKRDVSPYIERAYRDEIANVATAQDGTKHEVLRNAAIKLGSLIAHGLSEQQIETALYNAISGRADDPDNALRTIQDGIAYGKLHPREIPDRTSDRTSDQQVITPAAPRFTIAREEALMDLPPVRYLDRYLGLVAKAFHLIYGASGSGKTFFAIERAMRQVAQGRRVLYIATEDVQGLRYRIAAWRLANPGVAGRLTWLQMPEGLDLQDYNQVAELIEAVEPYTYDHIILDTLREAHSGDENSSQDTRRINRAIQRLVVTGAAIDVIHHTGVNGERPRGSTALFGNADAVIKVEDDDGYIRIGFDKLRNAPPRDALLFGMVQQDTGLLDTDGESVVSVVLRPANQTSRRDAKLTPTQRKILQTLALSIFDNIGAKAAQVIDTAEITRRHTYLALAALKTRGFVSQGDKGDPYMITPAGRAQLAPDLKTAPSDHAYVASQSTSDPSDQQVITSDQHTTDSDVIHSDHTRRVITGSHVRTSDTDPAYRAAKPIHRPNINQQVARGRVLEGAELQRALADSADTTFSRFPDEDEDLF